MPTVPWFDVAGCGKAVPVRDFGFGRWRDARHRQVANELVRKPKAEELPRYDGYLG